MNFTEKTSEIWAKMKGISKWWWIGGGVVLVIILLVVFGGGGNGMTEMYTIARQDVVRAVRVSGTVEERNTVDLGFSATGRISSVQVQEGDTVWEGQLLASIESGSLAADLAAARADVAIRTAELAASQNNLEKTTDQEDTLVESAYRTLLSTDLVAKANNDQVTATTPIITGRYSGDEGVYKIIFDRKDVSFRDFEIRTFGIERSTSEVADVGPTPLGTQGLFISFPDQLSAYLDTTWYIAIPNVESTSYTANYNAYQEAIRQRDTAVTESSSEVIAATGGASIAQARLQGAEAEVARITSQIAERRIYAPFAGTVTFVDATRGETVSASDSVIGLVGTGELRVRAQIAEIDISEISAGDPVSLTLDAFSNETFAGTLAFVSSRDRQVDGVSVYEGIATFENPDSRIKSGMTAYLSITTGVASKVLAIPKRFIVVRDGKNFVNVVQGDKRIEKEITVGITGADSMVEVLSGLNEGDVVETP